MMTPGQRKTQENVTMPQLDDIEESEGEVLCESFLFLVLWDCIIKNLVSKRRVDVR